ncbi:MAG: NirD/YgiW/YdeI family stress tolerance protein [Lactobacillales bacterium]|jgi:uncharacterized protein (TIGR00156 family)|nr:NirD/YgiW/YdeI family stress tolerance protein [Lactobacillales bacterium]
MKKQILAVTTALLIATSAAAQLGPRGGFNGPSTTATTVEQALKMKDDAFVTLQGKIEQKVGKEKYLFRDKTGVIQIEIDDEDWRGLTITPQDTVEIKGEVDKGWRNTKVDVDQITKVK